ncbi:unnamed protein product [Closterium sp. NIES-53]
MIALCQEHSLEHRTKHIALRYFLARELQQRGQLRLAYVATKANTADIFTKALQPACFALLSLTTCSPPLCLWGAHGAGGIATGGTRSGGARSRGVGAGGAGTGGASSGSTRARGAGAAGAIFGGAGARAIGAGGASSGGAGVGGAGAGGASSGGACARGTGAGGASSGGARAGGAGDVGASTEETGAGGTTTAPPHRYDTRLQTLRWLERKEMERLEQERWELQQPMFPPPDASPAVSPPPWSQSPPIVLHYHVRPLPPRARPSSPTDDLCTALFCYSRRRSPPACVLLSPHESSLMVSSTPISDYYRAARLVVSRVLASLVTDPRASPLSISALTTAVGDFTTTRHLDYTTRVVAARPLSVGGESALGCDVLEDTQLDLDFLAAATPSLCAMLLSLEGEPNALNIPTPRTYREAVSDEWASQWKVAMDSELASWRSTCTYVDTVPPPRANVVDGMWLFKVKWPPGSLLVFKVRYMARGFSQREGVDFFQTFAPTPKMTTLRVLFHVAAQQGYELHSLGFSTTFLQGTGTQWSLRRPVYGLRQSPREWHDTLRSTLRDLGFRPSSANPSLFVCAGFTSFLILVYVLRRFGFQFSTTQPTPLAIDHRLTGPFPDEPFESSGPYTELVGCLMYMMTCTRPDLTFPLSVLSRFVATGRHRPIHWTVLGAGAVSWRSTRSSSVASSSAEAEIYVGAMAAQELPWFTFLLTDLGERPHSALTLFADNKTMILLCREP